MVSDDASKTGKEKARGANSTSFKKGEVHNPNGRPKKTACLTSLLVDELKKKPKLKDGQGKANDKTWAQLLAEALPAAAYKALLKGDIKPYALILERVEGKVPQAIEATGKDGGPIRYARELTDDELDAEIERLRRTRPARREAGAPESAAEST